MLNNSQLKTVLSLVPRLKDQVEQIELLKQAGQQSQLVVSACGLYNAGKSTLLNALAGYVNEEYFKTSNIRETCELRTLDLQGLSLLDTPGLDANTTDDQLAFEGILKADLILLVHNPRNGELDLLELDYLARIQEQSSESLVERLLLVLTNAVEISEQDKASLAQRIGLQFQAHFGGKPIFFWVDSRVYAKGVREEKNALVRLGAVCPLQQYLLDNLARLEHSRLEQRRKKQEWLYRRLKEEVMQEINIRKSNIENQAQQLKERLLRQERAAERVRQKLNAS